MAGISVQRDAVGIRAVASANSEQLSEVSASAYSRSSRKERRQNKKAAKETAQVLNDEEESEAKIVEVSFLIPPK